MRFQESNHALLANAQCSRAEIAFGIEAGPIMISRDQRES
jgi:hypothetical protein